METGFEYYAFISYKREDEKWAKWLQNKLENYRLPSVIRKEIPRLPKQIRPVFRDKTDLGVGILADSLRKELEHSQYLIVICSPQSAKSEWVGKEIATFVEMGRTNRIIPFVVEGEPNSKNQQLECFHPIIKKEIPEILGICVNEIGKQQAFVKVVAKLLDLRFDVLWNRFQREQRKKRIIAAVIGFVFLIGMGLIWDYYRTKTEYYNDYVEILGIPQGIYPLSKDEIKFRNESLKFSYCQRKLQTMDVVNSYGNSISKWRFKYKCFDPSIKKEFYYDKDGQLLYIIEKGILDIFWLKKIVAPDLSKFEFKDEKGNNTVSIQSASVYLGKDTSNYNKIYANNIDVKICKHKLEYDTFGRYKRVMYLNAYDDIVDDEEGVAGYEINYTDIGQVKDIRFLNKNGIYHSTRDSISKISYIYDIKGNIIQRTIEGADGKLVSLLTDSYSSLKIKYDIHGNVISMLYLGTDMKPVCSRFGYAEVRIEYRDDGLMKNSIYYDTFGNVTQQKNRETVKKAYQYDGNGKRTKVLHYNINEQVIEIE